MIPPSKQDIEAVKASGQFDHEWYLRTYPDVKLLGMDPAEHYLWLGARLNRSPSPSFDGVLYQRRNMAVATAGLNPLLHYINRGAREGRAISKPDSGHCAISPTSQARRIDWDNSRASSEPGSGITVITPTGNRIAAFNKCAQWLTTQTVQPDQWIVVDDGVVPLSDVFTFPNWVTYVRRLPQAGDATHTLSENLLAALPHVQHELVFMFEDDDWYAPHYLEYMLPFVQRYDLVGPNLITYYHLRGRVWKTGKPQTHTALAQTAFTSRAIPKLAEVCESGHWEVRERGIVDRHWWHSFDGNKHLIQDHPRIHVGFKGLFGRAGIAEGHDSSSWGYQPDQDLAFLQEGLGDDALFYYHWTRKPQKPWVIYTAIAGDYDVLRDPLHDNPLFDLVVFSDRPQTSEHWHWVPFDQDLREPVRTAKKPKVLPHLYFPQYEWSLWIDANIFITGDLLGYLASCIEAGLPIGQFRHPERDTAAEEAEICMQTGRDNSEIIMPQLQRYAAEGFDRQVPLYECNFIIRQHNSPTCISAMNIWWNEIGTGSKRDQISYPYALWKAEARVHSLADKGISVRKVDNMHYSGHGAIQVDEYKARLAVGKDRLVNRALAHG